MERRDLEINPTRRLRIIENVVLQETQKLNCELFKIAQKGQFKTGHESDICLQNHSLSEQHFWLFRKFQRYLSI